MQVSMHRRPLPPCRVVCPVRHVRPVRRRASRHVSPSHGVARRRRRLAGHAPLRPHSRPDPRRSQTAWRSRAERLHTDYALCCETKLEPDTRCPCESTTMLRCRGEMVSPKWMLLLAALHLIISSCHAGPLGPLPNITSIDLGLKEGSCSQGDMVYMPGDEFPGSGPCEKCVCSAGGVRCEKQQCELRPGCKALHRPDHCCPTYQCECEQEGRVYGNGEKLVDPADPCRVCYCQGGEVVCRRIACFVRDDCSPRLVPGRCCPEYDNCPLRGVTTLPGLTSATSSVSTIENVENPPTPPKENIKQEITIKEITPVSEIPVITDVKIKEILPSPSEVAEYSSSKSPLIPREATTEKNAKEQDTKTEEPTVIEVHSGTPTVTSVETSNPDDQNKNTDATPSKISLSTQDSINTNIYPSNVPIVSILGESPVTPEPLPVLTTKATIIEEEDTFDHNPAFPPLPDDFSVLRNHEDEIVPEPIIDNEHVPSHDNVAVGQSTSTDAAIKEHPTTTPKELSETTTVAAVEISKTATEIASTKVEEPTTTQVPIVKESPMLNLRSAIPTEILNIPSSVPEEINGELDETTTVNIITSTITSTTTETTKQKEETTTDTPKLSEDVKLTTENAVDTTTNIPEITMTTAKPSIIELVSTPKAQEQTTSSIARSNIATEESSQTELSSLPIETSDQNPPNVSTNDEASSPTIGILSTTPKILSTSSEVTTVSKANSDVTTGYENYETTEFTLNSFGSSETATDITELIKISSEPKKTAAIIDQSVNKNNHALTDLIKLVKDVASISDHTEESDTTAQVTSTSTSISESEELIPVNAGYKSKNKNFNQNSITEIPIKSKHPVNKQKVVEIEDDESESVTDSLPPNDKVEPTTRRPIIDNVSAGNMPFNKTEKKDIEIITESYVPTINRRPTKVILMTNEKTIDEQPLEDAPVTASAESVTESSASSEASQSTGRDISSSVEIDSGSTVEIANATLSSTQ